MRITLYPTRLAIAAIFCIALITGAARADDLQDAEAGDQAAQIRVGVARIIDDDPATLQSGIDFLHRAAGSANEVAARQLGALYLAGRSIPRDTDQASHFYEIAVWQGSRMALFEYALFLQSGQPTESQPDESQRLMRRSAELQYPPAVAWHAYPLLTSSSDVELALGRAWRQTLTDQDWAYGVASVAIEHERGELTTRDTEISSDMLTTLDDASRFIALGRVANNFASTSTVRYDPIFAAELFERALQGGSPWTTNNFAWLMSTSRSEAVLDGERAVQLMEASIAEHGEEGAWVDTLAAAYAEAGRFEEAVATQERALEIFEESSPNALPDAQHRLRLFESGEVYRE